MFVVTVEFEIAPAHLDAFRAAMSEQARQSLAREADCHQFDISYDSERPACCFLYEKYTDAPAFDSHLASDHFLTFNALVTPWVVSKIVRTWALDPADS